MGVLRDQHAGALPVFVGEDEGDDLPVLRPDVGDLAGEEAVTAGAGGEEQERQGQHKKSFHREVSLS